MRRFFLIASLATVLCLEVIAVQRFVISREHFVFDFLHRWHGARAMLFEQLSPYGEEVTNRIHMALVGRPLNPEQGQQSFLYPAFIAITIPHFLLPYPTALALWIVTQQVLLVIVCWLVVSNSQAKPKVAGSALAVITLAGVTNRYSLQNLGYAQFSGYVLFWLVLAWWLWEKESYLLAGAVLSLSASKPQLTFLIIPLWLLLAVALRHWSFLAGFSAATVLLLGIPFLLVGNWIPEFIGVADRAAGTIQDATYQGASLTMRLGSSALVVMALALFLCKSSAHQLKTNIGGLLSFGVLIALLNSPYFHGYDLVLTLLPLLFGLSILHDTPGLAAAWLQFMYWTTLVALPWILWFLAPNHSPDAIERWIIPLVTAALLAGLPLVQRQQRRKDPSALT